MTRSRRSLAIGFVLVGLSLSGCDLGGDPPPQISVGNPDPGCECDAISICLGGGQCVSDAHLAEGVACSNYADCPRLFGCCDGQCTYLETSEAHCGACGVTCAEGGTCANGTCVCGNDWKACAEGQTCVEGQCYCDEDVLACDGECDVDFATDPRHCGGCGLACDPGASCIDGACTPCNPSDRVCQDGVTRWIRIDDLGTGSAPVALDGVVVLHNDGSTGYSREAGVWAPSEPVELEDPDYALNSLLLGPPSAFPQYPDSLDRCTPQNAFPLGGPGSTVTVRIDQVQPGDRIHVLQLAECESFDGEFFGAGGIAVYIGEAPYLDGTWHRLADGAGALVEATVP